MRRPLSRKKIILLAIVGTLLISYALCLPGKLFNDPYCTVLQDKNHRLLSASIATDGQWRFPESDSIPLKFTKAIVACEDKRFSNHPGVDLLALSRAIRQNIKAGHVVSGGSTITMQLIRLSKHNPPRTFFQKFLEIILATRAEIRYSKKEILALYASHAPFGGNVVGLEAACWRYFGRGSTELSWSEAALLAVLPNNPALIHLSRQRDELRAKRDGLLQKLFRSGELDSLSYELALAESIPQQPQPLPRMAYHALDRLKKEGHTDQVILSTIDLELQERTEQIVDDYFKQIRGNQIFNAAALILDVKTGEALAYVGNTKSGADHQEDVDIVRSMRSTGSILKPFLYAALLDEGKILRRTLVPDVPVLIGGFSPKNFSKLHDGAVPADQALIRSLNIPAVHELREYRYEKFYDLLKELKMSSLKYPADHYGLTLVLGGAEGSLWDITGMYASGARTLVNYFERAGVNRYSKEEDIHPAVLIKQNKTEPATPGPNSFLNAASLWTTFETLKELYRPGEETGWKHFSSSKPIAWKTGTSFGFRDGWAIGVNPDFAVGVWVGNADGEGRPGLTGTEAAAPLLFNLFSILPGQAWFQKPASELTDVGVCAISGQRRSVYCERVDTVSVSLTGLSSEVCRFHKLIHLSADGKYRVHSECEPVDRIVAKPWFVLPPVQEFYYKSRNMSFKPLPPYRNDCEDPSSVASMGIIYPKQDSKIFLPRQLNGEDGVTVFEATHRNNASTVFWHMDGQYIGATRQSHRLAFAPPTGKHVLTLVDDSGETLQRSFEIISTR